MGQTVLELIQVSDGNLHKFHSEFVPMTPFHRGMGYTNRPRAARQIKAQFQRRPWFWSLNRLNGAARRGQVGDSSAVLTEVSGVGRAVIDATGNVKSV